MTVLTEGRHAAEFLLSEANGMRSRANIAIPSGTAAFVAGEVLGKITLDGTDITVTPDAGNTGNGVLTAADPATEQGAKAGTYRIVCIEPGTDVGQFAIFDPDGIQIGVATVAVAYDGVIKFTIADGSTDFIAGDAISFIVAAGSGNYVPLDLDAGDGSDVAAAIPLYGADATSAAAAVSAIVREAEVNLNLLTWPSGITADQKAAALASLAAAGVLAR